MPVWHEKTKRLVAAEKLVVLGVIQEQHPDRCRLFAQWKGFGWPILHDPIDVMGVRGVPIVTAIDEHGVVRSNRPRPEHFEQEFVEKSFDAPTGLPALSKATKPDLAALAGRAKTSGAASDWRNYGDALVLWGGPNRLDDAIGAYRRVVADTPDDGDAQFRLGVCYRMRYDLGRRRPGDFQHAVAQWGKALATNPNHYIWRRRIQQYGPRLDKPYPFYDWIRSARTEITARGQTPIALVAEPVGAELAGRAGFTPDLTAASEQPDPKGRINRDKAGLIQVETAVAPAQIRPGGAARVHVVFRPSEQKKAHWNNETGPLVLWLDLPPGWQADRRRLVATNGAAAVSNETRNLSFELRAPKDAKPGPVVLSAYALYYACEDVDGVCHYLRRDLEITIPVAAGP